MSDFTDAYLDELEAESIYIFREAVAQAMWPVLLFSIGKDSCVLLHLARKAFFPAPLPFPVLHVDTKWKFREMIAFRDAEASRAKERIFSHRNAAHQWDPRYQRPELWRLYNTRVFPGESMRVFPLSNWTELDVWRYVHRERIPLVDLYFAKPRPIVIRDEMLIMVDDDRLPLMPGEKPQERLVRFRTLGCYPLSGAVESNAATLDEVIAELETSQASERQGRLIDKDQAGAMEKKKREGYF